MKSIPNHKAPIIIGGIGGSGTRAVAAILEEAGVFIGSYLNHAKDNVQFSRLITNHHTHWKYPYAQLENRLNAFDRLFFGRSPTLPQLLSIYSSLAAPRFQNTRLLIRKSSEARTLIQHFSHWGFKQPRACFFLPQLSAHYPECNYVHVIRHGLDMAYSSNTMQLERWGPAFGIIAQEGTSMIANQLEFWIKVNRYVLEQCQVLFPGRYYLLNYDRLCKHPEPEISKLLGHLNINPIASTEALSKLIEIPESTGRHHRHIHSFSVDQIQAVRDLGFDVT